MDSHANGPATATRSASREHGKVGGEYDAIVSVEMIEAVGEAYWPNHLATLDRLLAPGGTFRRMWEFYLAYSEAGFRSGYPGVRQLQMTRDPA